MVYVIRLFQYGAAANLLGCICVCHDNDDSKHFHTCVYDYIIMLAAGSPIGVHELFNVISSTIL